MGDLKSEVQQQPFVACTHLTDLQFHLLEWWHIQPATLRLPLDLPPVALTLGPGMSLTSWPKADTHNTPQRAEVIRTGTRFTPSLWGPVRACGSTLSLLFQLYLHFSFPMACLLNFKLQHQMQRMQSCRHCLTSSYNCIRSNLCVYLLVVLLLWLNCGWYKVSNWKAMEGKDFLKK